MPTAELHQFIQSCSARILRTTDLEQAMRRARFLGELLWKNNLGIYQLAELETQLLQRYAGLFTLPYQSAPRRAYLHVLSKAYDSGGHTRIAEHLLHSELLQDAGVLVSEKAQTLSLNKLQRAKHGCVVLPRMRNSRQKIQRLLEHFAQYTTLLLHIHPHDIETVMAAAMAKKFCGTSVYLYNHADHVFSYGYGVMDKVLEISYFGWDLRAARGTLDKSVYVGIPLKLAAAEKNQAPRTALPEGHIATAGTAYKYRPSLGYSFPEFAQQLVATSKKDLVLIGPRLLLDWWWWRAARQMGQHAHFHPRMPYQQYLDFMAHASLYVDSFPMTGGTAFAEVVSQGLPCFGILTGAHGYSPADQLKSPSQAALLQDILAYLQNPVRPSVDQAAVIQQVRQVHAVEQVALRISRAGLMSKEESAPTWANPAAIRVDFYEKISASAKVFAPTVHCRPDWKLSLLFLRFWIQSRKHSALIKNKINL